MSSRKLDHEDDTTYWDHAPCRCTDWLIQAWEDVVYRSPSKGGNGFMSPEEIGEYVGLSADMLRRFATKPSQVGKTHRCSRSSYIGPVTKATGNPALVNAIAQHSGLTTPRPQKPSGRTADSIVNHAIEQIGDVLKDVGKAITERPLRQDDKRKIRDRFRSLRIVFDDFEATVSQSNVRRMERGSTA